jgi:hypothetical protein
VFRATSLGYEHPLPHKTSTTQEQQMRKALTFIPLIAQIARRRRRKRRLSAERAQRGARIGVPALIGLACAAAFLLRRRRRSAGGYDVSPGELARTDAPRAEAASRDADVATGAESTTEATGASADPLGSSATAAGTPPPGSGSVLPDTGADDPIVREETNSAAAKAARIGGTQPDPDSDER